MVCNNKVPDTELIYFLNNTLPDTDAEIDRCFKAIVNSSSESEEDVYWSLLWLSFRPLI